MRLSKSFVPTLKEIPNEAVVTSHRLMLRAGMIRMLSAGIYSFLPLGYRAIRKISEIIREEMNAIGGQEFHFPALNPKEIWEQTGRVKDFGDILFHIANREYVLAPTHEEIVASTAKGQIQSYKDLPQIWYQIQTKYRNETRPRSGVIRGRQFLMKDAYTLDATEEGLNTGYMLHDKAYRNIFDRCNLNYFVVGASSGAMGGSGSEEFMVKSDAGEDTVAHCTKCEYAANVEIATSKVEAKIRDKKSEEVKEISTPDVKTIDELCEFLKIDETQCAKSRVYIVDEKPVLVLMLGNDEVNETKLTKELGSAVRPAHPEELLEITGADAGSIGPINYKGRIIADKRLKDSNNIYSGANKNDYHLVGIDLKRDVKNIEYFDLRLISSGEGCPNCENKLDVFTAIELGHIFKLGTKYSEALGVTFLDEEGNEKPIIMGSYGIGVERVMACYIEQHNDENGIIWDKTIAPFQVHLMGLNMKNDDVVKASESIYENLAKEKIEVLFDDRTDAQAGYKFKEADLLGMPFQVIVGNKKLAEGKVEVKIRATGERMDVELDELVSKVQELVK